ncbi:hypothetical protein GCM10010307_70270 [Streptomyces vastus]|uniref:Uncharacterized protein n=1 Tax=Streptomyces vastus TaxID=285451 RepID=A0ABN3RN29_9ACTN
MINIKRFSLAAAVTLAVSVTAPHSTSAAPQHGPPKSPPSSGWFNTGPETNNKIFDSGSVHISWGPVYVLPPGPGEDPSWIYYVIRYENYSSTTEELDCEGYSAPDTAKQLIRPTDGDLGEPFTAEKTVCSDTGGQWKGTLEPGETLEQGVWFDEVPPSGATVSVELQDEYGYPGASEYQSPYWERYEGDQTPPDGP